MNIPTVPQARALQLAIDDGGYFITGGLDKRPVRIDMALRMYQLGWLRISSNHLPNSTRWYITSEGEQALARYYAPRTRPRSRNRSGSRRLT